jgi:hypothetical protein
MSFAEIFLFISIFIFMLAVRAYLKTLVPKEKQNPLESSESIADKHCPPHKWQYEIQTFPNGSSEEIMICRRCRMRPGMIPTSYDKPY